MKGLTPGKYSLVYRMGIIITVIVIMQVITVLANNLNVYSITAQNIIEAQKMSMAVVKEQIKSSLKSATTAINDLSVDYLKDNTGYRDKNEIKKYLASMTMTWQLEKKITNNSILGCVFFSSPENDIYLTRFSSKLTWEQKLGLDDYIKARKDFENDAIEETWHIQTIGNVNYLMQVYRTNNVNMGIFVPIAGFTQIIDELSSKSKAQFVFTDMQGNILASGGANLLDGTTVVDNTGVGLSRSFKDNILITLPIEGTPVKFSSISYPTNLYNGLGATQYSLMFFGIAIITVIGLVTVYLRKEIVFPVRKLIHATQEVEQGNLDYAIREDVKSTEFSTLVSSFNNMVKEIKALKILSYEEKLDRQKAELKYLQIQLKPHFYLNAINTISSLSMQKKNREIGKFVVALSDYLRYLFTDNLVLSTVRSEIEHGVDYIKLQLIKFPNMIFYYTSVDKEAADFLLPKLMVQTFIENIFKHAFNGDQMLSVFIKAQIVQSHGESMARITIEDNGEGFSREYLERFGDNREEGMGIGIDNIRKTLKLTYGREDLLLLSNSDEGGARIQILIPSVSEKVKE